MKGPSTVVEALVARNRPTESLGHLTQGVPDSPCYGRQLSRRRVDRPLRGANERPERGAFRPALRSGLDRAIRPVQGAAHMWDRHQVSTEDANEALAGVEVVVRLRPEEHLRSRTHRPIQATNRPSRRDLSVSSSPVSTARPVALIR